MSTRNYANDKVSASWLNLDSIREGCDGEGDWFSDDGRVNPAFTSQSDRAGNTTQSADARGNGSFTLNVLRSSKLFTQLKNIHETDKELKTQVGNFTITDLEKDEKFIYKNARISDWPGLTFGPTVQVIGIPFIYESMGSPVATVVNIIGS